MDIKIEEQIPLSTPDWIDLFNHPEFYKIHKLDTSIYLSIFYKKRLAAVFHFTEIQKGIFKSPFRGTYGGISLNPDLSFHTIYEIIGLLVLYFKDKEILKVEIITEPFAHCLHKSSVLFNILVEKGFSVINQEINHSLIISEDLLVERMMRNNKKRYKKGVKDGFVFKEVFSNFEIEKVFHLIKENRESNGHKISMSLDQIILMYTIFPSKMHFFIVSQLDNHLAASICLKISEEVLYVFYWADKSGFESYSPVVYLANGIYEFAKNMNFKILDVGTSSLNGISNIGLITFKENLGFKISPKLTYKYTSCIGT